MTNQVLHEYIEISWATCPKWATNQEAECVDVVESIDGALTVVMIDVQGSGSNGGRRLALTLIGFCRDLLTRGIAGGDAANAAHQHLLALRGGKVGASIHCITFQPDISSIGITGYGPLAVSVQSDRRWTSTTVSADLAGHSTSVPMESYVFALDRTGVAVLASDGVVALNELLAEDSPSELDASMVLDASNQYDSGRPNSDKSIVVMTRRSSPVSDRRRLCSKLLPVATRKSV